MPAPDSYTEISFSAFLHDALRETAQVLGWSPEAGNYAEIINETLLTYGESDITAITGPQNVKRLRSLGRVEAWRAVVAATAGDYNFEADGGKYSRSDLHKMAVENLGMAQAVAGQYDSSLNVGIDSVNYKHDPYVYRSEDERPE